MSTNFEIIADELNISPKQVSLVSELLEDGGTVPFIARYRKEITGGLDEVEIVSIRDKIEKLQQLKKRKDAIIKSLKERFLLTSKLIEKINIANSISALEDIYFPFRVKRKTRGSIAKEQGLEPLAKIIFENQNCNPDKEARKFINPEKGILSIKDAYKGVVDIIAEWINEDEETRIQLRSLFQKTGRIESGVIKSKQKDAEKYQDYFELSESIKTIPSHRFLAIMRGAAEKLLKYHILPDENIALSTLISRFVKSKGAAAKLIIIAVEEGYHRLLSPSLETEMKNWCKEIADREAILVFTANLRELLLSPPLGQKNVMAIDPGIRTGCKIVCLNEQGALITSDTIYPFPPRNQKKESGMKISALCSKHKIEAIAVGNGTGGRETIAFLKELNLKDIPVIIVNESGASIYSASKAAREEFPDKDITVRGSVSIGRRLMDPLSELIKIDPKSIGVGQYQHDVNQKQLKKSLNDVVESCVNSVGVEVNTAGKELLCAVSGLSEKLASNIVEYREKNGPFESREQIKKVNGMGRKSFEQAAGFLRIGHADNPLDQSAVHPESYGIVKQMAFNMNCEVSNLISDENLRNGIVLKDYITDTTGLPTLNDIILELAKPGRDPREKFEIFSFQDGINSISDLKKGMKLPGIITNVTAFGAFADIGVHQDGLIHISCLSDSFVKNPADIIKVHQKVNVTVINIDEKRKRISLSMINGI